MRRGTQLIHTGHEIDPTTGILGVPVYQVSTFDQGDLSVPQEFDYARSGNPTRKALEEAIALLEGGARESMRSGAESRLFLPFSGSFQVETISSPQRTFMEVPGEFYTHTSSIGGLR